MTTRFPTVILAFLFLAGAAAAASEELSEARLRSREFVVMGYQGIAAELSAGEGPYLKSLLELLAVADKDRSMTLARLRQLEEQKPNIMDFADAVSGLQNEPLAPSIEKQEAIPQGPSIYSGDRLDQALAHLTRGMKISVFLRGGEKFDGVFDEYTSGRLWISGAKTRSFRRREILALDAPSL